jgi:hypothetical protein
MSIVSKSGSLNLLENSRPVIGRYRDCFIFTCAVLGRKENLELFYTVESKVKFILVQDVNVCGGAKFNSSHSYH